VDHHPKHSDAFSFLQSERIRAKSGPSVRMVGERGAGAEVVVALAQPRGNAVEWLSNGYGFSPCVRQEVPGGEKTPVWLLSDKTKRDIRGRWSRAHSGGLDGLGVRTGYLDKSRREERESRFEWRRVTRKRALGSIPQKSIPSTALARVTMDGGTRSRHGGGALERKKGRSGAPWRREGDSVTVRGFGRVRIAKRAKGVMERKEKEHDSSGSFRYESRTDY